MDSVLKSGLVMCSVSVVMINAFEKKSTCKTLNFRSRKVIIINGLLYFNQFKTKRGRLS